MYFEMFTDNLAVERVRHGCHGRRRPAERRRNGYFQQCLSCSKTWTLEVGESGLLCRLSSVDALILVDTNCF